MNPSSGEYYVVVVNDFELPAIDESYLQGFRAGLEKDAPDAAQSLRISRVDTPQRGSARYDYTHTYPGVGTLHTYGYLVATGRAVNIFAQAPAGEPAGLKSFAASLRVIKQPSQTRGDPSTDIPATGGVWLGYVILLLLGIGIGKTVNRLGRRRILNSAFTGLLLMLPLFALQIWIMLAQGDRMVDASPEKQGELVGYFLGSGLIMFFVAGALAIRESKSAGTAA